MITEREVRYATQIAAAIMGCFDEDSEHFIDPSELDDSDNATAFVHEMATMAPNMVYRHLTGDEQDNLGFNHLCNRLCVQFQNKKSDVEQG